jgi:hypothetical protein
MKKEDVMRRTGYVGRRGHTQCRKCGSPRTVKVSVRLDNLDADGKFDGSVVCQSVNLCDDCGLELAEKLINHIEDMRNR